jgi:tetraacyldisaccharide 4'-kinase
LKKIILDSVTGKRSAPALLKCFLRASSRLWRLVIRARHVAYDKQLFKSVSVNVPTFSIGNIAIGGTGKTPLVHLLTDALQETGNVAILTRGFRSQFEKEKIPMLISEGNGPLYSVEECGDEPFFLSLKTKACIWVGRNRRCSARLAEMHGAHCLILDDGMQHRKLARDVEIVTVDGTDPLSGGRLVPAGALRDLPERLRCADLIVATHVRTLAHYEEVKKQLSDYTRAPVVGMEHTLLEPNWIQGRKVGAFCGIGKPDHFYDLITAHQGQVVGMLSLLDHEAAHEEELTSFAEECLKLGAELLVCTEKDAVKLKDNLKLPLRVVPLAVRLEITAGREHWEAALDKMKTLMKKVMT